MGWGIREGVVVVEQRIKKLECFCRLTSLGPKLAWRRGRNHRRRPPTRDKCVLVLADSCYKEMRGADLLMLRDDPGWVLRL